MKQILVYTVVMASLGVWTSLVAAQDMTPNKSAAAKRSASARVSDAEKRALAREQEALRAFESQPLSDEQLALAAQVQLGTVACEGADKVAVRALPSGGKFVLELGKRSFWMVPVATNSGALRLEDGMRGVVWLQLANKSMLLDQRQGRRLADSCMNDAQHQAAREMERNPASHLLYEPTSPGSLSVVARTPGP